MDAVQKLLQPRRVAIIGASADPGKLTGRPMAYLQRHGFSGEIYPVNPRYETIGGLPCYADVASLPHAPDVGIVLVGADRVNDAVRQLSEAGTAAAIVLASGFGEAGVEGMRRQQELKQAAGSMRLLGPNTIGLVNLTDSIMLSASGAMDMETFTAGNIGLVSQSGGILGSLLSRAMARGIGFSKLVATGNEVDLDVSDVMAELLKDEATAVIALYLETLRKPEQFRAVAAEAARIGKPIVAFKVGRSESGMRSAVSHTGALAGADRAYDALFGQYGIIRAEVFADLLDIPAALAPRRKLAGPRIAIVTSTGGAATLIADSAGLAGFDTPAPDEATAARLMALNIRDAVLDRNPIDVTLAGLRPDLFRTIIGTLFDSPAYDAVVVVVGSSGIGQPELVAKPVIESFTPDSKPLLVYVSPDAPAIVRHLNQHGAPAFSAPESCTSALAAMLRASTASPVASPVTRQPSAAPDLGFPSGALNEVESKQLFARFGIQPTQEFAVRTPGEAAAAAQRLGRPVVLKILSRQILHKTEVGGVAIGVHPEDVERRCTEMKAAVERASAQDIEGFLVQERVEGGTELILGFHRDPQLGPSLLLGLGGVATELYKDTTLRLTPVSPQEARGMVDDLTASVLLKGFRGRPKADLDALAAAIAAFSTMIESLGEQLVEAEINPLFVLPNGQGVRAADGLVVLK